MYKLNQKVRVKASGFESYISQISEQGIDKYWVWNKGYFAESELELIPTDKTWDTLEVGDKLFYDTGKEVRSNKIIGICGEAIILENSINYTWSNKIATIKQLQDSEYFIG